MALRQPIVDLDTVRVFVQRPGPLVKVRVTVAKVQMNDSPFAFPDLRLVVAVDISGDQCALEFGQGASVIRIEIGAHPGRESRAEVRCLA